MKPSHYIQLALAALGAGLGAAAASFPSHAPLFVGLALIALAAAKPFAVGSEIAGDKS
jgi:hypothetical protein